uniref:histone-lysine N-methyltransferase, H3 lysine-9 specific SUVH5-like n=1 Tax=Erigeron canadensis TaxID=72917 RepID=UPI001CB9A93F|nr:histone-lysine N-methyltransferase, H3 lysine-9 specific SUVH5-like [Erigeron canadensis]
MEVLDNTYEPFVSIKRQLAAVDDRELEDFVESRRTVSKFPPPGVQVVRDFPPAGCGIKLERKPLNNLDNRNLCENISSNDIKKKFKGSTPIENNIEYKCYNPKKLEQTKSNCSRPSGKVKCLELPCLKKGEKNKFKFKPKERVKKKSYFASRPPSKVKPWDPTSLKKSITIVSREEVVQRGKIKELIDLFNDLYDQKSFEDKSVHWKTAQHEVARIVKQKLKWIEPEKVLGSVCGVRIGDKFRFRLQLHMIGLHRQLESGIDYTEINGKNLAISIVDSHRYLNESISSDMLIYSGHGGIGSWGCNVPIKDQKLEKGNLALKNSMDEKNPIRVIRKVEVVGKSDVFLYDGFYYVNRYTEKLNNAGKIEFRFKLFRLPGQPESSINF